MQGQRTDTDIRNELKNRRLLEEKAPQIWLSFKQGNEEAFTELMELYYPSMLNYGLRFQKDRELVKDCIQDLFLELWKGRNSIGDVRAPKIYLLISLRRKLLREMGRLKWFREAPEVSDDYNFEVQFAIETYLINTEIQHEDLKKLKRCLGQLTKRQREAIYLRFFHELSYEEIAETMEINRHSAVNLVYEAIRFIKNNWIYP